MVFLILLIAYSYFLTFHRFYGAEYTEYYGYTESLVLDGDLNRINNRGRFHDIATETYNYPDFHPHGGVVFWSYFFAYGEALRYVFSGLTGAFHGDPFLDPNSFTELLMSLHALLFSVFTLMLTFRLLSPHYSNRVVVFALILIGLGIPLPLYTVYMPGNANIIAVFLSTMLVSTLHRISGKSDFSSWYFLGLLFSVGCITKVDLWFHGITISVFLVISLDLSGDRKAFLKRGTALLAGFMTVWPLKVVNNTLMYGMGGEPELGTLHTGYNLLVDMLFSPYRGAFFISPILLVCMLGAILTIRDLRKQTRREGRPGRARARKGRSPNHPGRSAIVEGPEKGGGSRAGAERVSMLKLIMISYFCAFLVKTIFRSFGYAWGGGSFGRVLVTEFPLFVFLLCETLDHLKLGKRGLTVSFVCLLPLSLWTFFNALLFRWITNCRPVFTLEGRFQVIRDLFAASQAGSFFRLSFLSFPMALEKTVILLSTVLLGLLCYVILRRAIRRPPDFLRIFVIFGVLTYGGVTLLNLTNNQRNVNRMIAEGAYKGVRIIAPDEIVAEENIASMEEMLRVYAGRGNGVMFERVQQCLFRYLERIGRLDEYLEARQGP